MTCAWHWLWESTNATMVMVINNATFQRTTLVGQHLPSFLHRERFTHVIYQQPHRNCFFDYLDGGKNPAARCVNLSMINLPRTSLIHRRLLEHYCRTHGVPFLTVLGWSDAQSYAQALTMDDEKSGAISGTIFNATLYPYEVLEAPCISQLCRDNIAGHHCLPGALTLFALRLIRLLQKMKPQPRPTSQGLPQG